MDILKEGSGVDRQDIRGSMGERYPLNSAVDMGLDADKYAAAIGALITGGAIAGIRQQALMKGIPEEEKTWGFFYCQANDRDSGIFHVGDPNAKVKEQIIRTEVVEPEELNKYLGKMFLENEVLAIKRVIDEETGTSFYFVEKKSTNESDI